MPDFCQSAVRGDARHRGAPSPRSAASARIHTRGLAQAVLYGTAAATLLLLLFASPAAAQFVCTTNASGGMDCTNSGAVPGSESNTVATGSVSTTNSGSVGGQIQTSTNTGDATTTNSGSVGTSIGTTANNGNATTTNSGSVVLGSINTVTITGNATTTNSGSVGNQIQSITSTGDATTTNSGSVGFSIGATANNGNATITNSGSVVLGSITAFTTTGNATTTNSGSVGDQIQSITNTGNATTTNSGSIGTLLLTTVTATGDATTTNSGSVGFSIGTTANNGNATTTNSGSVVLGSINSVTTTGNATTTNSGSVGKQVQSITTTGNATTTNSGSVSIAIRTFTSTGNATTTNSGSVGSFINTRADNGDAAVTNSGSVGDFIESHVTATGNATVTNSGSAGSISATAVNGNATTTNSGAVSGGIETATQITGNATTTNSGFVGGGMIVMAPGSAAVTNSGTVNGATFVVGGTGETFTNSGTLNAFGGTAIFFGGSGPDTLNLLAGSKIIGGINLIGTNDTVDFISGNHNLTFNTLSGSTVIGDIPFVVVGNRAVAIDPTPFAVADVNLLDFTRAVSDAIPGDGGQSAAARIIAGGQAPLGFAAPDTNAARVDDAFAAIPGLYAYADNGAPFFKAPTVRYGDNMTVWARGFAGQRWQSGDGALQHSLNQFYGGMVGGDYLARPDLRLGAFVGAGWTRSAVDLTSTADTSTLVFGGLYGRYTWGASFIKLAVQAGGSNNGTNRIINNNTLPSGIEIATASANGWYVSPEASYGYHYGLGSFAGASYTLTPSVKVRYLHAGFDGYTETGTTAPLTVGARSVDDFEERGELKLTRAIVFAPTKAIETSLYGGVLGVERTGDTIDATLLGQLVPFAVPGKADVVGGFGGGALQLRADNVTLFASAEYLAFTDASSVVSGQAGIRVGF